MRRFALTLTAALMASATAVTAMEALDLDIDRDGFATKEEINQVLGGISPSDFNQLDLNNDGRLSNKELIEPGVRGIIGRYEASMSIVHGISDVDTNGDDFATQAELAAVYEGLKDTDFRAIDMNSDGRVNAKELYAPRAQAIVTRYEMAPTMQITIMTVDTDGDFFASFDELKASYPNLSQNDFRQIDVNGDGRLHSREYYTLEAQTVFDRSGS